jgi:Flp pilus assembly pilin Flp
LAKISNALAGYEVRLVKSVNTAWTKVSDTAYDRVGKPIVEAAL